MATPHSYSYDELNENYSGDIILYDIETITVDINGIPTDLIDAIQGGQISAYQISASARMDAAEGICKEFYTSENGLSAFTYTYPNYNLQVINDIYETPDGKLHHIESLHFYYYDKNFSTAYYDETSQFGYTIDREDWGIEFTVNTITPTSLTLDYTQSGGQQIGKLFVDNYYTIIAEDGTFLQPLTVETAIPLEEQTPIASIQSNSASQFTINWESVYGPLPAGEYCIHFWLKDVYDETQIHPLMKNFTDSQKYGIIFNIP